MTDPTCPRCGFNLEADKLVKRDGFVLDPRGFVNWRGQAVAMRPSWAIILHTLAQSERPVARDAMLSRISASDNANLLASTLSQLRKALRRQGVPDPIGSAHHSPALWWRTPCN